MSPGVNEGQEQSAMDTAAPHRGNKLGDLGNSRQREASLQADITDQFRSTVIAAPVPGPDNDHRVTAEVRLFFVDPAPTQYNNDSGPIDAESEVGSWHSSDEEGRDTLSLPSVKYTFPALIVNGQSTGDWVHVRKTQNYQSNGPVENVNSEAIRCYQLSPGNNGATTADVSAGSTVGFTVSPSTYHPGPLAFYMAKVPAGQTADGWDGSGAAWFKIYHDGISSSGSGGLTWVSDSKSQVSVKIPSCLADGEYLLRVEHIGLHSASGTNGAQFYISCAQIRVSGGGGQTPNSGLVSLPGAYRASDPGLLINIHYPVPTSYQNPGPAVWSC